MYVVVYETVLGGVVRFIGAEGWGWFIATKIIQIVIVMWVLCSTPDTSTSATEDTTCQSVLQSTNIAPLKRE